MKNKPNIQHFEVPVPVDEEIHKLACLLKIEVRRHNENEVLLT